MFDLPGVDAVPPRQNLPYVACLSRATLLYSGGQKIGKGHAVHEGGEEGLALHLTKSRIPMKREANGGAVMEKGYTNTVDNVRS